MDGAGRSSRRAWLKRILLGGLAAPLLGRASAGAEIAGETRELMQALGLAISSGAVPAPAFVLPALSGPPVRLEDQAGQVVLLYFWTTW